MRIVAGAYGGRRLDVPKGRDIRPTSDKVRGAIFNALEAQGAVQGARVLDCFCGTGALGLEALSRGAASCMFWDKDRQSLDLAKRNADTLEAMSRSSFKQQDCLRVNAPDDGECYSLLFLDPPYRKDILSTVLKQLSDCGYIEDGAFCVLEMEKGHDPNAGGSFSVHSQKNYGDTDVWVMCYSTV